MKRPRRPGDFNWDTVTLLDEEFDNTDIGDIVGSSRGERRASPRRSGEHRRSNRFTEDGYGELDFA